MEIFIVALKLIFLVGIAHFTPTSAYSSGSPKSACESLIPGHNTPPQTTPCPYKVLLQKTSLYPNTPLNITLTGRDNFVGFLVQVRKVESNRQNDVQSTVLGGEFGGSNKYAKTIDCFDKPHTAITHTGPEPKQNVVLQWTPKIPGQYRVHATFAKTKDVFWANQVHDQIIEVLAPKQQQGPNGHPSSNGDDRAELCSTMKLIQHSEAEQTASPYQVKVAPKAENHGSPHKVYQKQLMWINVSSEFGTPITKLFVQVRPQQSSKTPIAVGTFIGLSQPKPSVQQRQSPEQEGEVELVDCFGGRHNAILFVNRFHKTKTISDVHILWESPADRVGDFKVVATAISQDEYFLDNVVDDEETGKIIVLSNLSPGTTTTTSTGGSGNKHDHDHTTSTSSSTVSPFMGFGLGVAAFIIYFGKLELI